jgi:L-fuconolactonase
MTSSRRLFFDSHARPVADDQAHCPRDPMQRAADAPYRAPGVIGRPGGQHGPGPAAKVPDASRMLQSMKQENVGGAVPAAR